MSGDQQSGGLQSYALSERPKLLRFLAARGAGDEAEDLLHELWQRIAASPVQPVADPMAYLFRAAENLIRDTRRSRLSREKRQYEWHDTSVTPEEQPLGERVLIAREKLSFGLIVSKGLARR
jgi:RNA polymerase sigma-70 factor (ECF subfamily)